MVENKITINNVRGFGGRAGKRSMITDRGGTGIAGNRRTTREKNYSVNIFRNMLLFSFYQFEHHD
jgi:hypothetical protein